MDSTRLAAQTVRFRAIKFACLVLIAALLPTRTLNAACFQEIQPPSSTASSSAGIEAQQPLSPAKALAAFAVPDDLEIEIALAEPNISQPVFFNFDERGRMWVMNYLQYPYPAGLKMVSRDKVF